MTVTLPVDTTPPAAPVVSVTGTTSSTVSVAWDPVTDDDYTCCTYRVFADGVLVSADNLQWTGERAVTVLRLAAATTHSFTIVAVDPSLHRRGRLLERAVIVGAGQAGQQ